MLQKDSIDFKEDEDAATVGADEYSEINDDDDDDRVGAVRPSLDCCCGCLCKDKEIVSAANVDDGVKLVLVLRDVQVVSVLMTKSM
jgi:hypothetical protein